MVKKWEYINDHSQNIGIYRRSWSKYWKQGAAKLGKKGEMMGITQVPNFAASWVVGFEGTIASEYYFSFGIPVARKTYVDFNLQNKRTDKTVMLVKKKQN